MRVMVMQINLLLIAAIPVTGENLNEYFANIGRHLADAFDP